MGVGGCEEGGERGERGGGEGGEGGGEGEGGGGEGDGRGERGEGEVKGEGWGTLLLEYSGTRVLRI